MTENNAILVLLGRDAQGKPHAGRFSEADAEAAATEARRLGYHAVRVSEPSLKGLAGNLPLGKIYATGRVFVPFTKVETYDKLATLVPVESGGAEQSEAQASPEPQPSPEEARVRPEPASEPATPQPRFAPRNRDEIGRGSLVLAYDPESEAWYEAIVHVPLNDSFRLTWRDYAHEGPITRRRNELALLPAIAA